MLKIGILDNNNIGKNKSFSISNIVVYCYNNNDSLDICLSNIKEKWHSLFWDNNNSISSIDINVVYNNNDIVFDKLLCDILCNIYLNNNSDNIGSILGNIIRNNNGVDIGISKYDLSLFQYNSSIPYNNKYSDIVVCVFGNNNTISSFHKVICMYVVVSDIKKDIGNKCISIQYDVNILYDDNGIFKECCSICQIKEDIDVGLYCKEYNNKDICFNMLCKKIYKNIFENKYRLMFFDNDISDNVKEKVLQFIYDKYNVEVYNKWNNFNIDIVVDDVDDVSVSKYSFLDIGDKQWEIINDIIKNSDSEVIISLKYLLNTNTIFGVNNIGDIVISGMGNNTISVFGILAQSKNQYCDNMCTNNNVCNIREHNNISCNMLEYICDNLFIDKSIIDNVVNEYNDMKKIYGENNNVVSIDKIIFDLKNEVINVYCKEIIPIDGDNKAIYGSLYVTNNIYNKIMSHDIFRDNNFVVYVNRNMYFNKK